LPIFGLTGVAPGDSLLGSGLPGTAQRITVWSSAHGVISRYPVFGFT
jgi:hypothetical protein